MRVDERCRRCEVKSHWCLGCGSHTGRHDRERCEDCEVEYRLGPLLPESRGRYEAKIREDWGVEDWSPG